MFPNLNAEQARYNLSDSQMGDILQISRSAYNNKKRKGKFVVSEIVILLETFHCNFDYLFKM